MALDTIQSVHSLFSEISRFGKLKDYSLFSFDPETSTRGCLTIYTQVNEYRIGFRLPSNGDRGYLGCVSSCRTPRAGEDWRRGSDLADGPLTVETWHKILADIVSREMVKVHKHKEPVADQVPAGQGI